MHKPMLWSMVLIVLLVSSALLSGDAHAAERALPIRIGALTDSWGPTPMIMALRDGLLVLGYREPEQFVLGVRFTQGDQTALPKVDYLGLEDRFAGRLFFLVGKQGIVRGKWIGEDLAVFPK